MDAGRGAHVPIKLERQPDTVKIESTSVDDDIGGCLQAGDAAGITVETEPLGASDSWIVIGDKVMHKVERVVKKGIAYAIRKFKCRPVCKRVDIICFLIFNSVIVLSSVFAIF